ncbi:MAG: hypothetical protein M5R36_10265 [Deltaproteobacteria bacterium]|nr:hypothetical protein [Deltaproteobacteria bacterium]
MTDQNPDYRALAAMGLRDTFREVGWGFGYTSVQGPSRSLGDVFRYYARLDYVWHSADTDAVAIEIVDMPTGSDHHPLLATLAWK